MEGKEGRTRSISLPGPVSVVASSPPGLSFPLFLECGNPTPLLVSLTLAWWQVAGLPELCLTATVCLLTLSTPTPVLILPGGEHLQ